MARRRLVPALGGAQRTRVVLVLAAVLALSSADTATVGAAAVELRHALHIGNTEVGLLVAVTAIVAAVFSLPFGALADRVRRTYLLGLAVLTWSMAMVWSATSGSFAQLLYARLALGAVSAAAGPVVASLVGDWFFASERGRIYSFVLTGELLGAGAGFAVTGDVAALSWRLAFVVLAVPALPVAWWVFHLPEPARGGAGALRPESASGLGNYPDGAGTTSRPEGAGAVSSSWPPPRTGAGAGNAGRDWPPPPTGAGAGNAGLEWPAPLTPPTGARAWPPPSPGSVPRTWPPPPRSAARGGINQPGAPLGGVSGPAPPPNSSPQQHTTAATAGASPWPPPRRGSPGPKLTDAQRLVLERGVRANTALAAKARPGMSFVDAVRYVFAVRTNVALIVSGALGYYFLAGIETFGQEFVSAQYHISQVLANLLLLLVGAGAVAGVLVAGPLGDRLLRRGRISGRVMVAAVSASATVVLLAPALATHSALGALPYIMLAAACLSAQNPPIDAARLDIVPSWLWGRAEGVRTFVRTGAQALAPLLFGAVSEYVFGGGNGGLYWTFVVMLAPLSASAAYLFFAAHRYPTDVATAVAAEAAAAR
jgi:MFS family permease